MRVARPLAHLLQVPFASHDRVAPVQSQGQVPLQPLKALETSPFTAEFDATVHKLLGHYNVTGLSAAVVIGGLTFSKGYGIAQFPDVPVTPETMFFTQSTTKAFTAAAVSLLVDDDKVYPEVKWTTPINNLIPEDFVLEDDYYTRHVTIQDAASHRSGLPRHDLSYKGNNQTVKDIVRSLRFLPLTKPLRTTFQYCNLMFITLGHLVESLTGVWLGDFLSERIWQPLGMNSTYFSLNDARASGKPLARGYTWLDGSATFMETSYEDLTASEGAGAIISNVIDYSKWIRMMINRDGPISAMGHQELVTPHMLQGERSPESLMLYGYGWEIQQYKGFDIIQHNGAGAGFGIQVLYIPEKKWGCVLMSNTDLTSNVVADILTWKLVHDVLNVPVSERFNRTKEYDKGLELFHKARNETWAREYIFPADKVGNVSRSLPLAAYAGLYDNDGYGELRIDYENGTLWNHLQRKNVLEWDARLHHLSGDTFFVVAYLKNSPEDPIYTYAEFKVDVWGRVEQMGIALEDEMLPDMIWFKREADAGAGGTRPMAE